MSSRRVTVDAELAVVSVLLTALYITMAGLASRRFVWYDELFTFDIARASSAHHVLDLIRRWDLNPPTSYFLSRWSMRVFGSTTFGLRLPSLVEFYVASVLFFAYVRRKTSTPCAALMLLILWWSEGFRFATEARPYALILMCFAALLLVWERGTAVGSRRVALSIVAASSLGLVSAHVFGPLTLVAFITAGLARDLRLRRVDWPLWCALLLPTLMMVFYIPLLHTYGPVLAPYSIQASWQKVLGFYGATCSSVALIVALAGLAALLVAGLGRREPFRQPLRRSQDLHANELLVFAFLFISPILLNLLLMHGSRPYRNRYNLTAEVAIYVALVIGSARLLRTSKRAGYAACLVVVVFLLIYRIPALVHPARPTNVISFDGLREDLALVSDSHVTFFEMNHYESPELLSRLYYLKDRPAAVRYAHGTEGEDYTPAKSDTAFSIRGQVCEYRAFVAQHRQFLVFATHDNPEGWLLQKLRAEGAQLRSLGEFTAPGSYRASTLYAVNLPPSAVKRQLGRRAQSRAVSAPPGYRLDIHWEHASWIVDASQDRSAGTDAPFAAAPHVARPYGAAWR